MIDIHLPAVAEGADALRAAAQKGCQSENRQIPDAFSADRVHPPAILYLHISLDPHADKQVDHTQEQRQDQKLHRVVKRIEPKRFQLRGFTEEGA